jgi:hypothetical protein
MRICFLAFGTAPEIARVMIASVRQHMPNVTVTQLTDTVTKKIPEVDEVLRVEGKTYPYILYKHMSSIPEPFIRVDYDMIFQGDITHILEDDIDFAFNLHGDKRVQETWGKAYPYATCIWGAKKRSREFAEDFRERHIVSRRNDWMGLIPSVNEVIVSGKYKVKALSGDVYNYCPEDRDDRPENALVLHFKGKRKHWMLPEGSEHLAKKDEDRVLENVKGLFGFEKGR